MKRYERGELRRMEWLDGLALRAVDRLRAEVPRVLAALSISHGNCQAAAGFLKRQQQLT